MNKKNTLLSLTTLLALGLSFTACMTEDNENPNTISPITRLTATLNGVSEKPTSTTSPATGTFVGNLNTTTRVLSYTVTYQGFPANDQPVAGHLHKVTQANGTGPVDIPFPSLTSPIIATTSPLAQSKVDSMLAGFYYANIHTPRFPAGAIRGDIKRR
ncbi:CHRD domain-containing protein [Spirosoma taeanense]|uniref:CHRD domain-containing protein n=1 Tax=Spirosoma taeanense TaxID=2735870 RepID=A0A6M5YAJ2_9BACT|nr:CHRD domain-containing protein [Spirosoma taeanense]QJW90223.1 CHRD domain-containing protein [Spirosoma taeanense]